MSQNLNDKVDRIVEDVGDLKIAVAKLDVSHVKTNSILERITDSVEYHIKRSDKLEELVALIKEEHIQLKNNQVATEKKIEAKTEVAPSKPKKKYYHNKPKGDNTKKPSAPKKPAPTKAPKNPSK
jgi:hypothetical protein